MGEQVDAGVQALAFRRTECDGYLQNVKPPLRKHLDHLPPHWVQDASVYFITVCATQRGSNQFCLPRIGAEILKSIRHYHDNSRWFCHLAVVMPDHIHLLLSFPDVPSYARTIGEWKKWLTKHEQISWQENFFDHRLRNEENLGQKADYILQNPIRADLITDAKAWPYQWMPDRG